MKLKSGLVKIAASGVLAIAGAGFYGCESDGSISPALMYLSGMGYNMRANQTSNPQRAAGFRALGNLMQQGAQWKHEKEVAREGRDQIIIIDGKKYRIID
jgi:hypothetical protein